MLFTAKVALLKTHLSVRWLGFRISLHRVMSQGLVRE